MMNLASHFFENQEITLEPCVINNKSCIVYPKGLEYSSPDFFKKLNNFVNSKGILLKEERRSKKNISKYSFERRRWIPALILSVGMLFDNVAIAGNAEKYVKVVPENEVQRKIVLRLISKIENLSLNQKRVKSKNIKSEKLPSLQSKTASTLYTILKKHYVKRNYDPEYIDSDLKKMANYYSQFSEATNLIYSIKQKNWILTYDENIWSTVAKGRALEVNKATIHFNTRSAAKLKLHNSCKDNPVCIASPADALLHELLHAQSMLINTEEFISQGGMNPSLYPWKHEYAIIKKENDLYASMSKSDMLKRPQRNEHSGRKIVASCVTCIK